MRELGQLEAVIMERLWSTAQPLTVREVLVELQQQRTIAYTTVMTVMSNLHQKGLLLRELEGSAYRYRSAQTREQHNADLMREILAGSADQTATLLHFIDQMPPAEVTQLREALQQDVTRVQRRRRR